MYHSVYCLRNRSPLSLSAVQVLHQQSGGVGPRKMMNDDGGGGGSAKDDEFFVAAENFFLLLQNVPDREEGMMKYDH